MHPKMFCVTSRTEMTVNRFRNENQVVLKAGNMNSYSDKQPHAFDLKHYMLSNVCRRSCPRASSGCQRLGAQAAKAGMSSIFNFLKNSDAIKKEYDIESKGATPCAFIRLPSRPSAQLRGVWDAWQGRGACRLWWWLLLRCA